MKTMKDEPYSLFLKQVLLLLPVRLDGVLRQELHELQRLFDLHQDLINLPSFDLGEEETAAPGSAALKRLASVKKPPKKTSSEGQLTGRQKTSSSVERLFLMVDIGMP